MSRSLRIEYPGAVYHVTSRENNRQDIFLDGDDRIAFLEIVHQICDPFNWLCHAYCQMTNHYHLLLETIDPTLSRGMRQLNGVYTQTFNRHHDRVGHLFQGRFKAILVDKDAYLLEICRYVVLNPVRAKLVRSVKDWKWYRSTAGMEEPLAFLTVDWILSQFDDRRLEAQKAYRRFVSCGREISPWEDLKGQIYLGRDTFVENLSKSVKLAEVSRRQRLVSRPSLTDILRNAEDNAAIAGAYREYGYTMKEIANHLGVHYATISRRLRKHERSEQVSF
ncbi:MAG TPA: addiction module toxin RelE [Dehalococcoidia bacterium]|nr:addiction module toxin RelE [Dehalococcoidia bacterium]